MIMMNSEEEFGINQFKIEDVDLLKNNLDLIICKGKTVTEQKSCWV